MSRPADRPRGTERIRELLARRAPDPPAELRTGAAVLLLLRPGPSASDAEVLLIQRTSRPEDPAAGQVSLPGGHVDPSDRTLRETALRETREEVGLAREDLDGDPRYVGARRAAAFDMTVAVFAAALAPTARPAKAACADEVAEVFWLPEPSLLRVEPVPRLTRDGVRPVAATRYRDFVLWGFTRRVLLDFFGHEDGGAEGPGPMPPVPDGSPGSGGPRRPEKGGAAPP